MQKIDEARLVELWEKKVSQRAIARTLGVTHRAVMKRLTKLGLIPSKEVPESFDDLTDNQRVFVQEYLGGKTQTEAVKSAYNLAERNAQRKCSSVKNSKTVQRAICDRMEQYGIGSAVRLDALKKCLTSGDLNLVAKVLPLAFKLAGDMPKEGTEPTGPDMSFTVVNVNLPKPPQRLHTPFRAIDVTPEEKS